MRQKVVFIVLFILCGFSAVAQERADSLEQRITLSQSSDPDSLQHQLSSAREREHELRSFMMAVGLFFLLITVTLLFFLQQSKTQRYRLERMNLTMEKSNLTKDLAQKEKELATNIMFLLNKNELITILSEKLVDIKKSLPSELQGSIQKLIIDLQSNLQPELWQEFEVRFQQAHEPFYKILHQKFPDLSPGERRLCAFLKLNMTTKEIAAITHQNAKSIDVARTRLRKKLNLTGTDHNLVVYLAQIDALTKDREN